MSLPASGPIDIKDIHVECGGSINDLNKNIQSIRDNLWTAYMPISNVIEYDDANGFGYASSNIQTVHPYRFTADELLNIDLTAVTYDGYIYDFLPINTQTIGQGSPTTGSFLIFYNCLNPYSCFISNIYTNAVFPPTTGNYVYSSDFNGYRGKTRYNEHSNPLE
jgi:hypothetical protein